MAKIGVVRVFVLLLVITVLSCGLCVGGESDELVVSTKSIATVEKPGLVTWFSWSPDGRFLSYSVSVMADQDYRQEIVLVDLSEPDLDIEKSRHLNIDGRLTGGAWITWFKDSRRLILTDGGGIRSRSCIVDLESGEKKEIAVPDEWVIFSASYSTKANMIVCSAVHFDTSEWHKIEPYYRMVNLEYFRPWRIALIDLDNNEFRLIPDDTVAGEQFSPSWSADGKSISYCVAEDGFESLACSCFSLDLATGVKKKEFDKGEEYVFSGVSRDGTIQILAKQDLSRDHYLGAFAVKTDGSGEMWRLTDSLPGRKPTNYREAFSSDVRFVADFLRKGDEVTLEERRFKLWLRIRELKTGRQKLLDAYLQSNDSFPLAWSPNGRRLCYLRLDRQYPGQFIEIMMAAIEE